MTDLSDLPSLTVLYVTSDTAHAREITRELHAIAGFDVHTVATAADALECLATGADVDCVLSDAALPDRDGIALLGAVRAIDGHLPFVLYPRERSIPHLRRVLSASATAYLQREADPTHVTELAIRIQNLVRSHRTERLLNERVKELETIHRLMKLLTGANWPDEEVLADVVALISDAFQYPEQTAVRLVVGETTVCTDGFEVTTDTLKSDGETATGIGIELEVGYLEERPPEDEGPFLTEERELLEMTVLLLTGCLDRRSYIDGLAESERQFHRLAENVREIVWICGPEKEELYYVNRAYEAVWGRSIESLYQQPSSFFTAVHPEDRARVERAIADQATGAYDEEYRIVRPDGEVRWVHDRAVPVRDDDGKVYRIVGLTADVTERKEREQQLAIFDRVLRHNLRNELNVILGNAEQIVAEADGQLATAGDAIVTASERLLELATKQRFVARVIAKPRASQPQDLEEVLARVVTEFQERYPDSMIELDVGPTEPVTTTPHLEVAVRELVDNALRHSDREEPLARVEATAAADGLEIRVIDDGPGIPVDEREFLTTGQAENALLHGSGMGLWLVHWIVTYAGGRLSFGENEPRGSIVTISLPQKEVERTHAASRDAG
ncbi:PAS domain-containing protein [Natronobeatus ordinarius]|uniref:PAS domain-containing protein n=1 Tax=Natronobeatus ordinarius TaxID=2963433 RepID=UPI0020CD49CA|nr:PAS domain-containing protein [Natronobeatus ordinarius]